MPDTLYCGTYTTLCEDGDSGKFTIENTTISPFRNGVYLEYLEELFQWNEIIEQNIEKINNKYYIGAVFLIDGLYLVSDTISTEIFFYMSEMIMTSYFNYCRMHLFPIQIEIFQFQYTERGESHGILKTCWIRRIQRAWRKRREQTRNQYYSALRLRELGRGRLIVRSRLTGIM